VNTASREISEHWSPLAVTAEMVAVLGLARTGLIFTGLQEGAQPGGGG